MTAHPALSLALLGLLTGCGGTGEPPPAADPNRLIIPIGAFEVPPGDSFECFYTSFTTDRELSVRDAVGKQGPGGHHITVYYTNVPRPPEHHPCTDEEMVEWQQVAGTGGDDMAGEGIVTLPEGLATRIPAGKQIVVQLHYINTSGKKYSVEHDVALVLADPAKIRAYANYFAINDGTFMIPAGQRHQRTATCTVPRELKVVLMLGHMHELGRHYRLERLGADGKAIETLIDTGWQPVYTSHPPVTRFPMDKPYVLPKDTRLRQTCQWDNDTPEVVRFPREMCVAFMYYFPDMGDVYCHNVRPE